MAKFDDALRNTLIGYFNAGDQPSEANFTELITAIQEGIEEHDHSGTGDGDGVNDLVGPVGVGTATPATYLHGVPGIAVYGATSAGISLANAGTNDVDWLLYTLNDDLFFYESAAAHGAGVDRVTFKSGGYVGLGLSPAYKLDVLEDDAGGFVANFFNDGDDINRHVLLLQGGGEGADVGTTYFIYAGDHAAVGTGWIGTVNGVFQLVDISDEGRKANIEDTKIVGLDIINGLKVRDFNWKANPKGPMMTSFVAQEAQEVYPAMVGEFLSGELGTSRAMLIPVLVKAIQELHELLEAK